eukprot:360578-Chlamydomonas_euryale.AAC.15
MPGHMARGAMHSIHAPPTLVIHCQPKPPPSPLCAGDLIATQQPRTRAHAYDVGHHMRLDRAGSVPRSCRRASHPRAPPPALTRACRARARPRLQVVVDARNAVGDRLHQLPQRSLSLVLCLIPPEAHHVLVDGVAAHAKARQCLVAGQLRHLAPQLRHYHVH